MYVLSKKGVETFPHLRGKIFDAMWHPLTREHVKVRVRGQVTWNIYHASFLRRVHRKLGGRMTDQEVKALYMKVDPGGGLGEDDPKWWADAIRTTRQALEAKTHKEAVEVLRRASWGEPESCAREIRREKPCQACHGEGVVPS